MKHVVVLLASASLLGAGCGDVDASPSKAKGPDTLVAEANTDNAIPAAERRAVSCENALQSEAIVAPKSVPGRFKTVAAWRRIPAQVLQASIGTSTELPDGGKTYINLGNLSDLHEQSEVLFLKQGISALPDTSLQIRPEALQKLNTLTDELLFVGISQSLVGPRIDIVLWVTPTGAFEVAGTCDDGSVRAFLDAYASDHAPAEPSDILESLVTDPQASERLTTWRRGTPIGWMDLDPSVRQIDPDATPTEVLESLTTIEIQLELPDSWRTGNVVCSRTALAWNDCYTLSLEEGSLSVDFLAHVDGATDGVLEFWILDGDVNLSQPLLRIGTIAYQAGTSHLTLQAIDESGKPLSELIAEGKPVDLFEVKP